MPRHRSSEQPTTPRTGQALTLFGRTVIRLIAVAVVLVCLYPVAESQTGTVVVPSGREGLVAGAQQAAADSDDEDDEERSPNSAAAVARAGARADEIAAEAAQPAPRAQAPEKAAEPAAPAAEVPRTAAAGVTAGPVGGAGRALNWAPPAGYTHYPVEKVTAVDALNSVDGGGGDVYIQLPRTQSVAPLVIKNCRNAVVIGGHITVLPTAELEGSDQRGIYVTNCTGTVHIEGITIDGDVAGSQSDGIAVNAPQAVVQIQNVRVEGMRGAHAGNHADVFQPWGGVKEFRIDRLTGTTNYQGLHIKQGLGPIGRGTIRNTNIASSGVTPIDRGGQFIWMDCNGYPLTLDNVYVAGRADRSFGTSIWPKPDAGGCPAVVASGMAMWPAYTSLSGGVREGRPAADFVPAGSVGLNYTSPGYL